MLYMQLSLFWLLMDGVGAGGRDGGGYGAMRGTGSLEHVDASSTIIGDRFGGCMFVSGGRSGVSSGVVGSSMVGGVA